MFFFKSHAENESGRLVLDLFLFFKNALHEVKNKWSAAQFQQILIALTLAYNENKLFKTLDY